MSESLYEPDPDTYWEQDAVTERDERDLDARHVEDDERELTLRGEPA